MKLTLNKWGNSNGLRIPMKLIHALDATTGDVINASIDGNKIILEKASKEEVKELTIEELFKNYNGQRFDSKVVKFESMGDEEW